MTIEKAIAKLQYLAYQVTLESGERMIIIEKDVVEKLLRQVEESDDVSGSLLGEAKELLEEYDRWEADIITEDKLWWPNKAEDVLRGNIYDKMMELQKKRNDLLKRIK